MKMSSEEFLKKANEIHQERYQYPELNFKNVHNKIKIICEIHGEFYQQIWAHIKQKQGCPKCGLKNRKLPNQKTTEQFIQQANDKWQNKYDYSITSYINKITKIKYVCEEHGTIEQLPNLHLKNGCPYCNGRGISKHSKQSFVLIANKIHKNKYNYNKTNFVRMTDDVVITCPKHGDFIQRAGNHVHLENGCPKCTTISSKAEKSLLRFIKSIYNGTIIENDRTVLNGKEIDILLPDLNLGIEYYGIYWHTETVRGKKYHYSKWKEAKNKGIKLLQFYDIKWKEKRNIIKSMLHNAVGNSTKIPARKTNVIVLDKHTTSEFLIKNHIQGSDSSKISFGLTFGDKLVACMTFGLSRFNKKYKYELLRFCNLCNHTVIGGAAKLLSHFRRNYQGSIISYADKRYSNGNLYFKLGFELDGESHPSFNYFNLKTGRLYSRLNFQKHRIDGDPNLTEYENMQLKGFDRIWDAGQFRFVLS